MTLPEIARQFAVGLSDWLASPPEDTRGQPQGIFTTRLMNCHLPALHRQNSLF